MARGVAHSDELRAAVIADLLLGATISEVARRHGIHHGIHRKSVTGWADAAGMELATTAPVLQGETADLRASVAKYLDTSLEALTAQARVVADSQWIEKQPAES